MDFIVSHWEAVSSLLLSCVAIAIATISTKEIMQVYCFYKNIMADFFGITKKHSIFVEEKPFPFYI